MFSAGIVAGVLVKLLILGGTAGGVARVLGNFSDIQFFNGVLVSVVLIFASGVPVLEEAEVLTGVEFVAPEFEFTLAFRLRFMDLL